MTEFKLNIDLTEYEATMSTDENGVVRVDVKGNPFGMDGINSLKRNNSWNEPEGEIRDSFTLWVEEDELTIHLYNGTEIEEALKMVLDAYPSVGWEFLQKLEQ